MREFFDKICEFYIEKKNIKNKNIVQSFILIAITNNIR